LEVPGGGRSAREAKTHEKNRRGRRLLSIQSELTRLAVWYRLDKNLEKIDAQPGTRGVKAKPKI
jgi:hypothetical protein